MDTIIIQYNREGTTHAVITPLQDCLIISYGNVEYGIVKNSHREWLYFAEHPELRTIHDGRGWDLIKLAALMEGVGQR